ncbi:MAG: MMPL family transporter [Fibrobacter sp.]|uniref:MMPL family transporter n=1 Tax=Fibrobacter sp. TaxID=35828 RepID=UPI001AFD1768|nr:MMPL family transporter [Fibrobacter sp.]MBO7062608.1 MMPL family transporter [Fibrobacter sp.]
MFSFLAKTIRHISRFPKVVLAITFFFLCLCPYFISNLRWELQLQDILEKEDTVSQDLESIEKSFGGLGSLTVVLQSPDSLANYTLAKNVANQLMTYKDMIHFVEFETDINFYEKYKFFYINNDDLDTIINRVETLRNAHILRHNPLFVDLSDTSRIQDTATAQTTAEASAFANFHLEDIEHKYFDKLKRSHSNSDGTIRIIDIYPTHSIADLYASRELVSTVKRCIGNTVGSKGIDVYYTGKVYDVIQTGRAILPEAKSAGKIMALLILILLVIHFFKQPQLILISAIPIGIPVLLVLSIAQILYGRINLFSLVLVLLLPGLASQIITHILTRYFKERAHNLSPHLCIESALLGIGPSTAASALMMSLLFAGLTFIPLAGIKELGVLGAIGCLLNWGVCTLLITALLRIGQKKKPFKIPKFNFKYKYRFTLVSFRTNSILLTAVILASLVALFFGGTSLRVFYDFSQTELPHKESKADTLVAQTGFPQYDPIIVQLPSAKAGDSLVNNFQKLKKKGLAANIDKILTLSQISPALQPEKKAKLEKLESMISDSTVTENLTPQEKATFRRITQSLNVHSFEEDEFTLPLRKKFSDNEGNLGVFAFIFPNINPNNGLECRRLVSDLKNFDGVIDGSLKLSGTPILRATILDKIFPNLYKPIIFGSIIVFFMLLVFYNNLSRATFTVLPSCFALSWLLILLKFLNIEISIYSAIAIVFLIGASVDGSLQLWASFYEKQGGTALIVLQRKFTGIVISQMACLVGTYGLLISSHPGLKSIGVLSLIGLLCIFAAQLTIFPLIAGALDNYRIRKNQSNHD